MAQLAAQVDSLENVPESTRSFYKEIDGKFVLDIDVDSHPQVQGLKKAYQADHSKVRELQDNLGKFKDIDPERWSSLKDLNDEDLTLLAQAKAEKIKAALPINLKDIDIEAEIAKRLNPVKTAHQRELEQRELLLAAARSEKTQLEEHIKQISIRTALRDAAVAEGVLPSATEDAMLYGERFFRLDEHGEPMVVDREGMPVFGTDGKPKKPREWVAERAADKPHWFPVNTGGGAGGGRFNGEGHVARKSDFKTTQQKVDYIRRFGGDKFDSLPD